MTAIDFRDEDDFEDYEPVLKFITHTLNKFCDNFMPLGADRNNFYIAGGTVANLYSFFEDNKDKLPMLSNKAINHSLKEYLANSDIDIYVKANNTQDFEDKTRQIYKSYANNGTFQKGEVMRGYGPEEEVVCFNMNFSSYITMPINTVSLITFRYGDPKQVLSTFDFAHVKSYYDCGTKQLMVTKKQLGLMEDKYLIPVKKDVPQFRIDKWRNKGWKLLDNGSNLT